MNFLLILYSDSSHLKVIQRLVATAEGAVFCTLMVSWNRGPSPWTWAEIFNEASFKLTTGAREEVTILA